MATHYKTHPVLPSGRKFRCKIRRQTTCGTFSPFPQEKLRKSLRILGRQDVLRNHTYSEAWIDISMPDYTKQLR